MASLVVCLDDSTEVTLFSDGSVSVDLSAMRVARHELLGHISLYPDGSLNVWRCEDAMAGGPLPEPVKGEDRLSAALEEIRGREYRRDRNGAAAFRQSDDAARDVPRLLAALEKVLKLAGDFESATTPIDLYDRVAAGRAIREAITRALTGTEVQ